MLNPVIFTYKESNKTSKKLADALGCDRHVPGSGYEYQEGDLVVNWGCGNPLGLPQSAKILNKYRDVLKSVDKRKTFEYLHNAGVSIPRYTQLQEIAEDWIRQGNIVFQRNVLDGCNGLGIKVCRTVGELSPAPMYTKYVANDREFRVHVFRGEAIFWTEKVLASDAGPNPDPMIKSGEDWSMGWVDNVPDCVAYDAIAATAALDLDFAAIDIGYKDDGSPDTPMAWVFETNTAPGAFGRVTLAKYVEAIRKACIEEESRWARRI